MSDTKNNHPVSYSKIGLAGVSKFINKTADDKAYNTYKVSNAYKDKKSDEIVPTTNYSDRELMNQYFCILSEIMKRVRSNT